MQIGQMTRWSAVFLLGWMLLGCGQSGKLYLPPNPQAPAHLAR